MTAGEDEPVLILSHEGEGRVALLASDQAWLWARGFEGGGPQLELLRRIAHWSMQEPELEEEALLADVAGGLTLRITRRSLAAAYPSLGPLLSRSALAVDQEFAGDETPLRDGAEVAIVPPVSGGSGLRVSSPSLPLA